MERPINVSLATKLGISEGAVVALVHAPKEFEWTLPAGVRVARRRPPDHSDVVLAFFTRRRQLERDLEPLSQHVFPDGSLWVAWPKRASGIATDLTDHVTRELALPLGLVDNKVCAVDHTWTALRFVWRRERR
jgi:hypothetical protein